MTTRDKLAGTVLGPVDLDDQPQLPYIFLIDTSAGGRQAFSIDNFQMVNETVRGLRDNITIIAVPLAASWTILHRDLVVYRTVEESIRKHHADTTKEIALIESLGAVDKTPPLARQAMEAPKSSYDDTGLYR